MVHAERDLWHDPRPRPRDYQQVIRDGVLDTLRVRDRCVVEAATGTGKSLIMAMVSESYQRTLVIDPQVNLVHQIARSFEKWRLHDIGIEQESLWADPSDKCVVASLQTLTNGDRGRRFAPDLVMVDEAHWGLGEQTRDLLDYYASLGAKIVGFTATPHARPDGSSILAYYGSCPIQYGIAPAIDHGWLVPIRGRRVVLKSADYSRIKQSGADFSAKDLDRVLREERIVQEQAALVVGNHREPGAVFAASIPIATQLRDVIQRHGKRCSLVHSKMGAAERERELKDFETGVTDLIVNVATLVAGWDSLRVAEIHMLRPTRSLQRYMQVAGRALRPVGNTVDGQPTAYLRKLAIAGSEKPHATLIDYTDTHRYHRMCSSIDLAGNPRVEKYREKLLRNAEDEDIKIEDLDAQALAEERLEKERAAAEREAERQRRMQVVIGVTFDARSADLFEKPTAETPKRREARMLWGPWKGMPIRIIPRDDLKKIIRTMRRSPGNEWLVKAIQRELVKGVE
jgi:superfamily II DNA or RNA helicase